MFIAKLPTFEKRCETPAGTVLKFIQEDSPLCLIKLTPVCWTGWMKQLDMLLCSDLHLRSLHVHLFSHLSYCQQHQTPNMMKM